MMNRLKRSFLLIGAWLVLFVFPGHAAAPAAALAAVQPVPLPPGYPKAAGLILTVNGTPVPILKVELNKRHHEVFDVASFSSSGTMRIEVKADKPLEAVTILPAGDAAGLTVADNLCRFEIDRPRQLFIKIPGRNPLLLFANGAAAAEPAPGPSTFDVVKQYHADPTGKTESTAAIQKAIDAATIKGGTVLIPKGVFRSKKLVLKNDVRLHLAAGSALRFADQIDDGFDYTKDFPGLYFITTAGTRNISVTGLGLLDCNGETLHGGDRQRKLISAFRPIQITGLTIEGITIIDSSSWTMVPAFCRQVLIRNLKIVNSLCLYENDGIDPIGCQDVLVDHCFVVATDDAFCPKPGGVGTHGGGIKPGPAIDLRDVVFNDCVAWTRAAGFKVGRQSSIPTLNIVCKNSHILACSRGCVIDHDMGNAPFRNILFQDITIEGNEKTSPVHIETQAPGPTREVTYERLAINLEKFSGSKLAGKDDTSLVSDIRFIDCAVQGKPVAGGAGNPLRTAPNKFVKNIQYLYREPAKQPAGITLTAVWGTHLVQAPAGAPVPVPPAVLATDRENRPVAGVDIVFAVESGGGAVTQATVQTDARGIATLGGWTLGKEAGTNTLTARSQAAAGSHVVFMTSGTAKP